MRHSFFFQGNLLRGHSGSYLQGRLCLSPFPWGTFFSRFLKNIRSYYFRKPTWPSGEETVNIVAILPLLRNNCTTALAEWGLCTQQSLLLCHVTYECNSYTRPWGSLSLLTEMSTTNIKIMFLGSKLRLVRRADNLTAICEPIV
jgi:hypothetical protein